MNILHFNCEHCRQVLEINAEDFKEEFRNEEFICGEMFECPHCKVQTRCIVRKADFNKTKPQPKTYQESPPFIQPPPVIVESNRSKDNSNGWFFKVVLVGMFTLVVAIFLLNPLIGTRKESREIYQSSSQAESIDKKCSGLCSNIEVKMRYSGYLMIEGEFENIATTALKNITVHASFFNGKAKAYNETDSMNYLSPGEKWKFRVVGLREGLDGARIDGFTADIPIVGVSRLYVKYSNYIKSYDQ